MILLFIIIIIILFSISITWSSKGPLTVTVLRLIVVKLFRFCVKTESLRINLETHKEVKHRSIRLSVFLSDIYISLLKLFLRVFVYLSVCHMRIFYIFFIFTSNFSELKSTSRRSALPLTRLVLSARLVKLD